MPNSLKGSNMPAQFKGALRPPNWVTTKWKKMGLNLKPETRPELGIHRVDYDERYVWD